MTRVRATLYDAGISQPWCVPFALQLCGSIKISASVQGPGGRTLSSVTLSSVCNTKLLWTEQMCWCRHCTRQLIVFTQTLYTHTQRQGERYYWLLPLLNAHCVCLCYNRFVCLYRSCFVGTLWPLTCCFLLIPVTLSARSHHSPYDRKHPTSTNIYSLRRAEGTFPGTAASHMSDHCDRSIDFYCSLLGMLFSCTQDQLSTSPWLTSKLSIIVFLQFHITANYCERWMFVVLVFCSVSQLVSFFILSLTFSKMY